MDCNNISDKKELTDCLIKLDINDLVNCLNDQPKNIKKEFEKFVNDTNDERRKSSSIIRMREYHNWVKRTLIESVVSQIHSKNIYLLDIAVGRGGDLDKWNKAGIKGVFGFDYNTDSIYSNDPFNPGALERLKKYKINKGTFKQNVRFEVGNAMIPTNELLDSLELYKNKHSIQAFQIVSCQFALHYFYGHRLDLERVIQLVSVYLSKGGYFIGTTIDGAKIRNLFKSRKSKEHNSELFKVSIDKYYPRYDYYNDNTVFGQKYSFMIKDTGDVGNYFNTTGVSTEFVVSFEKLTEICQKYGLSPVTKNYLEPYQNGNTIAFPNTVSPNRPNPLPNVYPFNDSVKNWIPKKGTGPMTPAERELNSLYSAFVFVKN
jgi:mRNA (guanine-N7-)-methyltransferase